jgi:hypothetical protein
MLARLPKPSAAHRGWNKGDDTKGFVAEDPRPRVHPERRPEHEILSDRRAQHPPRRSDSRSQRGVCAWLLPPSPCHREQSTAEDEGEQCDQRDGAGVAAGVGQVPVGEFLKKLSHLFRAERPDDDHLVGGVDDERDDTRDRIRDGLAGS